MDTSGLRQASYPAYLAGVIEPEKAKYAGLEEFLQKQDSRESHALMLFLDDSQFGDRYVQILQMNDYKHNGFDTSRLERMVKHHPDWEKVLQQRFSIASIYDAQHNIKPEVLAYLRERCSEPQQTMALGTLILKQIDHQKMEHKLREWGSAIIDVIEKIIPERDHAETIYYKIIAGALIQRYVRRQFKN